MKCDPSVLYTLVEQSADPGEEAAAIAEHVESCAQCRETLAGLGGEPTWWDDAQHWLAEAPDSEYGWVDPSRAPLPQIDLHFLDESTHPEMLGRIGRYDVEEVLGRGGMGVVLRAYDSDLHRSVAVKVMAPEWATSATARQRFAREAQAAASVAHENVIPIYNVEASAKLPFLVMRYIPGSTLQQWVASNGPPDVATILRVAGQLVDGLQAAHRRGLVHRDIKPANILVGKNIQRVWITDFGLARAADDVMLTRTGVIAGTPHYMSPEQSRGQTVDHRSDLFSLGSVLYFLCTGRTPFDADNPLAVLHKIVSENPRPLTVLRSDLPPSLVSLVHRLLDRSPDKRHQDCAEISSQLSLAHHESKAGRCAKPPLSPSRRIGVVGIVAVSLIGLLLVSSRGRQNPFKVKPSTAATSPRVMPSKMKNPWAGDPPPPIANPYLQRAAELIHSAVAIDELRFEQQVKDFERDLRRLQLPPETMLVPVMMLDDGVWNEEVRQVQQFIEHSSQSH